MLGQHLYVAPVSLNLTALHKSYIEPAMHRRKVLSSRSRTESFNFFGCKTHILDGIYHLTYKNK